ncbi:MAG: hypothetical protein AAFN10_25590, partial [Bacteroidota bacterium]
SENNRQIKAEMPYCLFKLLSWHYEKGLGYPMLFTPMRNPFLLFSGVALAYLSASQNAHLQP